MKLVSTVKSYKFSEDNSGKEETLPALFLQLLKVYQVKISLDNYPYLGPTNKSMKFYGIKQDLGLKCSAG